MGLGLVWGWSDGAGLWTGLGLASAMGWSGSAKGLMGLWAVGVGWAAPWAGGGGLTGLRGAGN